MKGEGRGGRARNEGGEVEGGEQINLTILRFKNVLGVGCAVRARPGAQTGRFPEAVKTARAHAKKRRGKVNGEGIASCFAELLCFYNGVPIWVCLGPY